MGKIKTKFKCPPVILPVCLIGANVKGKPNFQAIAWFNMVDYDPYLIGENIACRKLTYLLFKIYGKNLVFQLDAEN